MSWHALIKGATPGTKMTLNQREVAGRNCSIGFIAVHISKDEEK